jgi:heat shock protein HslJ
MPYWRGKKMKKKMTIISLFLIGASLVLVACGATSEEQPDAGEKTIYVGPQLVDCEGVAPQKCMLVKEDPQAEYTLFYDPIEGFDYEEGYEYELRIKEETVENPPVDGSSLKWTLVEEVSKTPVEATETETVPQTEEVETISGGEVITMFVGPELLDCVGTGPQTCMQVKLNPESNYTLFYDQIEGFEFEPGYEYELRVLVEPVENPPADASSLKYTLVEEVSRTPVTADSVTTEDETTSDDFMLEGSTWTLLSYVAPDGQPTDMLPDTRITAEFKDDQISGSAGCNRYFGSYETDGNSLTIGPAGSTMMFCSPEENMLQETAYLATLSTVASYEIISDQLHLQNANGDTILLFSAEEPLSLSSVTWNLLNYNNGKEAMVSVIIGTEITAIFAEEGVLSGSGGCNNYTASYETDGEKITIRPAASTRKFCAEPEGIMEQESQYLAALENAAVYMVDSSNLEIRDANGSGVVSYESLEQAAETDGAAVEIDDTISETPEPVEAGMEAADEVTDATTILAEITTALGDASYPLDYTGSGTIQLTDGEYRQPAAEDSASEIVTQLTEHIAVGEMSSGEQVVAVILVSQTGGTGTFYDLVVMNVQDGQLSNPTSTYLGDRIVINSLTIDNDQIVVDMVVQGPEDPFCCPTQQVIQSYEQQGGELVQVSSDVIGTVAPHSEDFLDITTVVWKWQELITPVEQVTIDSPEKYTVEFKSDGELAVSADCNIGGGTYEINGKSISINITSTTLALCADGSYGDLFFRSLDGASTYFMDGDNLMIDQFADSGTMRFFE